MHVLGDMFVYRHPVQIYRALKPGGRFFASTFLDTALLPGIGQFDQKTGFHLYTVKELEELMRQAG